MTAFKDISRRDFLKTASAATLSALAAGYPRALLGADAAEEKIKPTADTLIVLWMGGGMAHTETFDPKRYTQIGRASCRERAWVPAAAAMAAEAAVRPGGASRVH